MPVPEVIRAMQLEGSPYLMHGLLFGGRSGW